MLFEPLTMGNMCIQQKFNGIFSYNYHENVLALNLHEEMVLNLVKILLKNLAPYSNGRCVQYHTIVTSKP
jgi:hypothetical protein